MRPRVFLVDDHPLFRRGVADLLRGDGNVEVVGEAEDAESALAQVAELLPDIVLLDLRLDSNPRVAGPSPIASPGRAMALIPQLLALHPALRIIVLTMFDEPAFQAAAQAANAHGYVTKGATDTKLLAAIEAVWSGSTYFESKPKGPATPTLTVREREVVRGIALGHTNREIAKLLGLSVKSIESYRSRVMQKFGFGSRADLVRFAFDHGLLDPEQVTGE